MRGANLNIDNKDGKKPVDLMTAKDAKCRTIVRLTTLLQSLMKDTKQNYFERIVSNDITNGKESLPIQVRFFRGFKIIFHALARDQT